MGNTGMVFLQAIDKAKDGSADHLQSWQDFRCLPVSLRHFSPNPDLTPSPARVAWPVAQK